MIDFNDYRLLMCDIDGTLVEKGGTPHDKTRAMLQWMHDQGKLLGLASGRPVDDRIIYKFEEWGFDFGADFLIGTNGVEIWDRRSRETKTAGLLSKEIVKDILEYVWPLDVNVVTFEKGYDLVLARRYDELLELSQQRNHSHVVLADKEDFLKHDLTKLELHYDEAMDEEVKSVIAKHQTDDFITTMTFKGTLEFMNPQVNKGEALRRICQEHDIDLKEVIACGDMDNDTEMIKEAGLGICLQNGSPASREAADYITDKPVEEDGLGEFFFAQM